MSATNQNNSKKSGSSNNSSMANTPASTPVSGMANGQTTTQTSPPPNNNAPKYGTLVPNRIFVGGISANTTEGELLQLFSNYGTVKAAKIIQDRAGVSKGYGFITFESEDDAKRLQREADNIVLRERKLNIAPAIKKQPFSRAFDASSPPAVAPGNPAQYFFQPGAMPYFQGGVAYYPQPPTGPSDPTTPQQAVYQPPSVYPTQSAPPQTAGYPPVMFPAQPIYMPQQYPMPMPYDYNYYAAAAAAAAAAGGGGGGGGYGQQQGGMQRPNSPPRGGPCYASQQLPGGATAYGVSGGAQDASAMYYNVPMYGPPGLDGSTMYATDTAQSMADMSAAMVANNTLAEDTATFSSMGKCPQHNTPPSPLPTTPPQHHVTDDREVSATQTIRNHGDKDIIVAATSHPKQHSSNISHHHNHQTTQHATTGSANVTPVVSLLSLDQHQDKDLLSMQSGRRKKLEKPGEATATASNHHAHHVPNYRHQHHSYNASPNGYFSYVATSTYQHQQQHAVSQYHPSNNGVYYLMPPTTHQQHQHHHHQQQLLQHQQQKYGMQQQQSSHNNGWLRKRRNFANERRSFETCSMTSSLRSDSNSSASVVDEAHRNNDEKHRMTGVNTPPPAPYSPIANYYKSYNTRNFTNTQRPHHQQPHNINNNNNHNKYSNNNYKQLQPTIGVAASGVALYPAVAPVQTTSAAAAASAATTTYLAKPPISPQMHAGTQHFAPPPRRNRRTVRRNGSSLSEIGAGDAPLQPANNTDSVSDACSKLDSLKL